MDAESESDYVSFTTRVFAGELFGQRRRKEKESLGESFS
jgi:hypothetical protein